MAKENKPATSLFKGELQITTCCLACNTKTVRDDLFRILTINIKGNSSNMKDSIGKKKTNASLEELIEKFSTEEKLNKMNKYDCSKCGKLQNATRQISIAVAPRILAIQLKRFSRIFKRERILTVKLEEMISFNKELELDTRLANLSFQAE